MSVIIPISKPKNCYEYGGCPLFDRQYRVCKIAKVDDYDFDKQYAHCPMREVDGTLFDAENARRYFGINLPDDCYVLREATQDERD